MDQWLYGAQSPWLRKKAIVTLPLYRGQMLDVKAPYMSGSTAGLHGSTNEELRIR